MVFQKIAGLDDYPVQSTINRVLNSFRVEPAKAKAQVNHNILGEIKKRALLLQSLFN